jgi:hypothetical protein
MFFRFLEARVLFYVCLAAVRACFLVQTAVRACFLARITVRLAYSLLCGGMRA